MVVLVDHAGVGGYSGLLGATTMPPPTTGVGFSSTLGLDATAHIGTSITP